MIALLLLVAQAGGWLPNGEFGKGIDGWMLVNNSRSAQVRHEKKTLRFDKERGGMDVLRSDFLRIPEPGTKFLLHARCKGDAIGNGWFKVFFYDAKGKNLGQGPDVQSLRGSYDWKRVTLHQKVPEGATSATIMILLMTPGTLWIDDVSVELPGAVERKPLEDRKLRAWLDKHAVAMTSLDPTASMADLKPLAKRLRGVRVVQLGENSHGDGLAFAAKVRLVRWLHATQGFDVVAFESGLFECERANALLKPGADPRAVMQASIFPIWHTKRTLPLFAYMAEQAGTRRPLGLTGFDLRLSGQGAKQLVPDALTALKAAGVVVQVQPDVPALRKLYRRHRADLVKAHGARRVELLAKSLELREAQTKFETLQGPEQVRFRDRVMGETLVWLATRRYPKSKIVCWAATVHQAHGLETVRRDQERPYADMRMAGQYAKAKLGRALYTIAFASHGGAAGLWHKGPFQLDEPAADSLEALLFRYGKSPLIVPLKGAPFDWPAPLSIFGYSRGFTADWSKVVDAVCYFDEMEPAQYMGRE